MISQNSENCSKQQIEDSFILFIDRLVFSTHFIIYRYAYIFLQLVSVFVRDAMTVEEFLASACNRKNLNPMEHFVRVKKRRDMEDHNYFVPHRTDLIETYVSILYNAYCVKLIERKDTQKPHQNSKFYNFRKLFHFLL